MRTENEVGGSLSSIGAGHPISEKYIKIKGTFLEFSEPLRAQGVSCLLRPIWDPQRERGRVLTHPYGKFKGFQVKPRKVTNLHTTWDHVCTEMKMFNAK